MSSRVEEEEEGQEVSAQSNRRNRDQFSLIKFDQELNLKREADLRPRLGKKNMEFQFAHKVGDQLYAFSSFLDRKEQKNLLMMQAINPADLSLSSKPVKVASTSIRNARNIGAFSKHESRKRDHFLIVGFEPYKRGENEKFNLQVFDREMNQLWDKQIQIPYRDELFFIERFLVDSRGDVYVLGKRYFDRPKTRRRGRPNYSYHILAYRYRGLEFEEYEIKLKDKFITDLSFTINDGGDLICAGFYSDRGAVSVKGTYFMSIDAISQQIKEEGFKEFEPDFLTQFMSDRQIARGRELFDYKLEEIILRADGGRYIDCGAIFCRCLYLYRSHRCFPHSILL